MKTKDFDPTRTQRVIDQHRQEQGAALPMLHAIQAEYGYVPEQALPMMASALNISLADLHGVVTFYHDFRLQPPARRTIKLCRAEACQAMGADALAARARQQLGLGWGQASADGAVALEAVFCLGLCAVAPAAMVDGQTYGRLDDARLDDLLKAQRS